MENKSFGDVIGSPAAPYLTSLAHRYAAPRDAFAIGHPSLPNYLALTGGDTFAIHDDCTSCRVQGRSVTDQLQGAGFSWRAYMEGMPRSCYRGASSGRYAKRHDPFMYFDRIRTSRQRCSRVVPFGRLDGDLAEHRLPDFAWITPDLCHDMHDCGVATGDRFAAKLVPRLLPALGPHGFLVVTWDEDNGHRGCCGGDAEGGRVATIVAGPDVKRGAAGSGPYDHYSILRTVDDAFGLAPLRHAGDAKPLDALFHHPPRIN
jgi:hypothetical protein